MSEQARESMQIEQGGWETRFISTNRQSASETLAIPSKGRSKETIQYIPTSTSAGIDAQRRV
jgi:hypothetical protein